MPPFRNHRRDGMADDGDRVVFEDAASDDSSSGDEETSSQHLDVLSNDNVNLRENVKAMSTAGESSVKNDFSLESDSDKVTTREPELLEEGRNNNSSAKPTQSGEADSSSHYVSGNCGDDGTVAINDQCETSDPNKYCSQGENVAGSSSTKETTDDSTGLDKLKAAPNDPWFVPRGSRYFLHDDRLDSSDTDLVGNRGGTRSGDDTGVRGSRIMYKAKQENVGNSEVLVNPDDVESAQSVPKAIQSHSGPTRKLWSNVPQEKKWEHDMFNELVGEPGFCDGRYPNRRHVKRGNGRYRGSQVNSRMHPWDQEFNATASNGEPSRNEYMGGKDDYFSRGHSTRYARGRNAGRYRYSEQWDYTEETSNPWTNMHDGWSRPRTVYENEFSNSGWKGSRIANDNSRLRSARRSGNNRRHFGSYSHGYSKRPVFGKNEWAPSAGPSASRHSPPSSQSRPGGGSRYASGQNHDSNNDDCRSEQSTATNGLIHDGSANTAYENNIEHLPARFSQMKF